MRELNNEIIQIDIYLLMQRIFEKALKDEDLLCEEKYWVLSHETFTQLKGQMRGKGKSLKALTHAFGIPFKADNNVPFGEVYLHSDHVFGEMTVSVNRPGATGTCKCKKCGCRV